ncbi:hypothetical protein B0H17DRAFT_1217790 [Mycena rosella]|uniref:Uncharacterized protein n=1 Tax=Mycena rosella TaxID=1033263 RepID=A0AAD7BWJ8_MYCRO|nr:hypothetical protein B0H17DRAFT_1217790 [Mycena rosella]
MGVRPLRAARAPGRVRPAVNASLRPGAAAAVGKGRGRSSVSVSSSGTLRTRSPPTPSSILPASCALHTAAPARRTRSSRALPRSSRRAPCTGEWARRPVLPTPEQHHLFAHLVSALGDARYACSTWYWPVYVATAVHQGDDSAERECAIRMSSFPGPSTSGAALPSLCALTLRKWLRWGSRPHLCALRVLRRVPPCPRSASSASASTTAPKPTLQRGAQKREVGDIGQLHDKVPLQSVGQEEEEEEEGDVAADPDCIIRAMESPSLASPAGAGAASPHTCTRRTPRRWSSMGRWKSRARRLPTSTAAPKANPKRFAGPGVRVVVARATSPSSCASPIHSAYPQRQTKTQRWGRVVRAARGEGCISRARTAQNPEKENKYSQPSK